MRLPILTIERVAPFFWVSLGLREADAFRMLIVQDFEHVTVEDGDDGMGEVGGLSPPQFHVAAPFILGDLV